jgi:hypothetical protein
MESKGTEGREYRGGSRIFLRLLMGLFALDGFVLCSPLPAACFKDQRIAGTLALRTAAAHAERNGEMSCEIPEGR